MYLCVYKNTTPSALDISSNIIQLIFCSIYWQRNVPLDEEVSPIFKEKNKSLDFLFSDLFQVSHDDDV